MCRWKTKTSEYVKMCVKYVNSSEKDDKMWNLWKCLKKLKMKEDDKMSNMWRWKFMERCRICEDVKRWKIWNMNRCWKCEDGKRWNAVEQVKIIKDEKDVE